MPNIKAQMSNQCQMCRSAILGTFQCLNYFLERIIAEKISDNS